MADPLHTDTLDAIRARAERIGAFFRGDAPGPCATGDIVVLSADALALADEVRRLRRLQWAARHVHDGAALEPLLTRERVEAHMHARGWTRGEERATGGYYWIHAEHDAITLPLRPSRVWWQSHFALGGYDVSDAIAVLADMLPEHGEWENVHG